ncbi:MAG: cyclically-permuted mutarotase family protein [Bacteroidaceae bacterium]
MKTIFKLLFLLLPISLWAQGNDNRHNAVAFSAASPLTIACNQGVSAPFAGLVNGHLLVCGGCNFPDVSASEGGSKMFYNKIVQLVDNKWFEIGSMPYAAAYGVSIPTRDGLMCIGGTNGKKSLKDVCFVRIQNGKAVLKTLSPLPIALDNMAGAADAEYCYVTGGQSDGVANHKLFRINSSKPNAEWEELPAFPGDARLQPVAAVQKSGTGDCFYLMGGYAPASEQKQATIHLYGLCYNPRTKAWTKTAPTHALIGCAAVASGSAHIAFVGGVNGTIFSKAINRPYFLAKAKAEGNKEEVKKLEAEAKNYLNHPVEWYKFNADILLYHTITDTWVSEGYSPLLARAGAGLVKNGQTWYVINGESKPGIRSADVTKVDLTTRASFGWLNWTVLALYMASMLLLGYYFMRKEASSDDFFKGGGRIPWWAAGISIYATMLSAITYMAIPAKSFATDWTYYPMLITILVVSFPVIKYYLPFFRRLNVTSAYEYLERRFNYATRLMASALFIVFMIARMALVLYLPSLALTTVTGIDIYLCIVLMGIITIIYCTMGGVEAVVWGDVVQGIILVGGAIFAAVYLILSTDGGASSFFSIAEANDKFRLFDWSFDYTKATFWVVILGGLANNLISYTSDQTVIQRYLTTNSEKSAGHSILMNGVMSAFISVAFYAIGTGLYTFFKTHPAELDYTMAGSDAIFPFFMMSQLPAGIAGLLIAAIFAATMSTISSNINSISTAFTVDVYKHFLPHINDKQMLRCARYTGIVSGLVGVALALLMATWNILSLLDYFNTILGLLSSGLGGLFVMGIFFDRIGARSALIGFLAGTLAVFYLNYQTSVSFLLFGAVGMVVSVVVGLLCSMTSPHTEAQRGLTWKQLDKKKR